MPEPHDPVAHHFARYQSAAQAKDLEAFIALYHPQVEVFDAWNCWRMQGLQAWRAAVAAWFSGLGEQPLVVDVALIGRHVGTDLAWACAWVEYAETAPDGGCGRSVVNRLSVVLRREAGDWRVVHEHSSMPLDAETGQALAGPG